MRSVIGVEAIDTLIGGGIFDGSTTMVVGVSGVGKTVLEHADSAGRSAQTKNQGIAHLAWMSIRRKSFVMLRPWGWTWKSRSPTEPSRSCSRVHKRLNIDAHYARIVQLIEQHDIQRMVIDGMTSYSTAIGEVSVYRDFFHAIVAYLQASFDDDFF